MEKEQCCRFRNTSKELEKILDENEANTNVLLQMITHLQVVVSGLKKTSTYSRMI